VPRPSLEQSQHKRRRAQSPGPDGPKPPPQAPPAWLTVEIQEEGKVKAGIKTRLCIHYRRSACRKGTACTFAHSEQELGQPYFEEEHTRPCLALGATSGGDSKATWSGRRTGQQWHRTSPGSSFIEIKSSAAADLGDLPMDSCVDMRQFRDPAAGELRMHDGRHPRIIRRLANHPAYAEWAREMQGYLDEFASKAVRRPLLVFFCNAGRHRSVAGSLILEYAAAQLGMACRLEHRSLSARQCSCQRCEGNDLERQGSLAWAWQRWQEAIGSPLL